MALPGGGKDLDRPGRRTLRGIDLDFSRVTAPIAGRIGSANVTEGALVTAADATPLAADRVGRHEGLEPVGLGTGAGIGGAGLLHGRLRGTGGSARHPPPPPDRPGLFARHRTDRRANRIGQCRVGRHEGLEPVGLGTGAGIGGAGLLHGRLRGVGLGAIGGGVTAADELPGRVVAFRTAEIRPQVGGIIQRRLFEQGAAAGPPGPRGLRRNSR
jgi:hypothetical protein